MLPQTSTTERIPQETERLGGFSAEAKTHHLTENTVQSRGYQMLYFVTFDYK